MILTYPKDASDILGISANHSGAACIDGSARFLVFGRRGRDSPVNA